MERWQAERVESDPRQGGQIVIDYDTHEKRGEFRRLIPGREVAISWSKFDEPVPIDLTGFKLDKVARGTRLRVVDFATPEDAAELQNLWAQRLKRLKKLYSVRPAAKRPATKKTTKRTTTTKSKPDKRQSTKKRTGR